MECSGCKGNKLCSACKGDKVVKVDPKQVAALMAIGIVPNKPSEMVCRMCFGNGMCPSCKGTGVTSD